MGVCTRHVSGNIFLQVVGQNKMKFTELKAQKLLESKCSKLGDHYIIPALYPNQNVQIQEQSLREKENDETEKEIQLGSETQEKATENIPTQRVEKGVSYLQAVKQKTQMKQAEIQDFDISEKPIERKEGEPAFVLTEEEMESSIKICKWFVILKFMQEIPNGDVIREHINTAWNLEQYPIVGSMNSK